MTCAVDMCTIGKFQRINRVLINRKWCDKVEIVVILEKMSEITREENIEH